MDRGAGLLVKRAADSAPYARERANYQSSAGQYYNRRTMFTRLRQRHVSLLLVLGLVFSQLMVAAYACSKLDGGAVVQVQAVTEVVPCDQMNMDEVAQADEPLRCLEHCKYGQQNVGSAVPADLPAGVLLALFEAPPLIVTEPPAPLVQASLLARATAPPQYARSQRLRL